jgi:hypothetical protein
VQKLDTNWVERQKTDVKRGGGRAARRVAASTKDQLALDSLGQHLPFGVPFDASRWQGQGQLQAAGAGGRSKRPRLDSPRNGFESQSEAVPAACNMCSGLPWVQARCIGGVCSKCSDGLTPQDVSVDRRLPAAPALGLAGGS